MGTRYTQAGYSWSNLSKVKLMERLIHTLLSCIAGHAKQQEKTADANLLKAANVNKPAIYPQPKSREH